MSLPKPWPFSAGAPFPPCTSFPTPVGRVPRRQPWRGRSPGTSRRTGPDGAAAVAAELEQDYLSALVGATLPVLFEEEKDGLWQGHAPNYVPVRVQGEDLHNQLRPVEITGIKGSTLVGRLL